MKNFTKEEIQYNKKLKKSMFEVLIENVDTFYIHCLDHPDLKIGERGLTDVEKKEGIVFVIGPYSYKDLSWDDNYISCEMNFAKWEKVFIPYESIFRFFDKAGHCLIQFLVIEIQEKKETKTSEEEKVIKIDFTKKQKEKL